MVVAPEHPLVDALTAPAWSEDTRPAWTGGYAKPEEAVAAYRSGAVAKTEVERQTEGREKTGVFTGSFAVNPATGTLIPVFVADYVLMGYGTGAIMGVPGQDERDWEFADPLRAAHRQNGGCRRMGGPARRISAKARPSTRRTTRSRSTACPSRRRRRRSVPGSKPKASVTGR